MSSTAAAQDAASTLEPVTLEWYVAEGSMPDNQLVFDALNTYFQEKINATVNFHFIASSEYGQKVSTILMSGQTVDIINANSLLSYVDYINKGAFLPIEDLIQQYAPATYEMIPESFWSAMYVNGHMYGIPSYKDSCQMYSMLYDATLAENLGLDMSTLSIDNYRDIVPFLYEAKELRDAKYPDDATLPITRTFPDLNSWAQHEVISGLAVVNVPGVEDFEGMGSGETVFNMYATAEFRDMSKTVAKMVTDGVLPFDLFNFDTSRVYNQQGKYILVDIGSGYVTVNKDQNSTEWDTAMIPFNAKIASTAYLHNAVECVAASSKNPERALMLLELINTDSYVATTLRFGVEGIDWNMSEVPGVLDFTGTKNSDPANRGHYYWYGAQFGSFIHSAVPAGYPANFTELILEANASAITDTNMGFVFDPTPVQNEIAACDSVIGEYEMNLKFGFIPEDEVDANIDEFLAKLEASGASKIVAEAQAQLDAWRAANK
jgi:putative aldouronate transport system substrate-binding protein